MQGGVSLWRNRLARSAVNRKVGGSSPPRDAWATYFRKVNALPFFPPCASSPGGNPQILERAQLSSLLPEFLVTKELLPSFACTY